MNTCLMLRDNIYALEVGCTERNCLQRSYGIMREWFDQPLVPACLLERSPLHKYICIDLISEF